MVDLCYSMPKNITEDQGALNKKMFVPFNFEIWIKNNLSFIR